MNNLDISITELILNTAVERFVYKDAISPQAILSTLALAGDRPAYKNIPDDEIWTPKQAFQDMSGTELTMLIEKEVKRLQEFTENLLNLCIFDIRLSASDSQHEFWYSIKAFDKNQALLWGKEKAARMRTGNEFYTLSIHQKGELVSEEIFV